MSQDIIDRIIKNGLTKLARDVLDVYDTKNLVIALAILAEKREILLMKKEPTT